MRTAGSSSQVTPLLKGNEQAQRVVAEYREWESVLERGNARDFPTTDGNIGDFIHIAAEMLSPSKRQLIHIACYEAMSHVEIRGAVVESGMVIVDVSSKCVGGAQTGGG